MAHLLDSDVPNLKKVPMRPTQYVPRPSTGPSRKVDKKMLSWYDWLVSHVTEPIKRPVSKAFTKMKGKVMSLFDSQQIGMVEGRRNHQNTVANYDVRNNQNTSPTDFLAKVKSTMLNLFESHPNNKIQLGLICKVVRVDSSNGGVIDSETPAFSSNNEFIFPKSDLEDVCKKMTTKMIESFSMYLKKGSGWILEEVVRLYISVNK